MASQSLQGTNISQTFDGLLHAQGDPLPTTGRQRIYDGVGSPSAIFVGRDKRGVSISGPLSCGGGIEGTVTIGTVYIPTVTDVTLTSTNNPIQIGLITGTNLVVDNNELQTRNNGASSNLVINDHGGNIRMGGVDISTYLTVTINDKLVVTEKVTSKTFNSTSSRRFKTNISKISNALDIVKKLEGVRYEWKQSGERDVGLIAEDVDEVLPELVIKDENGAPSGIDYAKIVSVLIEAIKELAQKK